MDLMSAFFSIEWNHNYGAVKQGGFTACQVLRLADGYKYGTTDSLSVL